MVVSRRAGPQGQPAHQTPARFQPGIGERVDVVPQLGAPAEPFTRMRTYTAKQEVTHRRREQ